MNKFTQISRYLEKILDTDEQIKKGEVIIPAIWKARSARLSDIAREMPGNESANYKCLQRFMAGIEPEQMTPRLYQEDAPFVIGDPTEMPRPQAKKTSYVGKLSDGRTNGFWILFLATPYQGRAIPFHFVNYSSKTIGAEATSRNRYHFQAFSQIKTILGDKPLVLDREFSYLELMQALNAEKVNFVIRLKVGPKFFDQHGKLVALSVKKGEKRILNKVFYMGKVFVNVIGWWQDGLREPLWVMTSLPAREGLAIYLQRMKIEQSFRDLKSLLGLHRLMNKKRSAMEKMVSIMLVAYAIGLVLGETMRQHLFPPNSRKHKAFSGLFVLLKLKITLSSRVFSSVSCQAIDSFSAIVCPVRTHVRI